jgi:phage major head subunit gpT-like protein
MGNIVTSDMTAALRTNIQAIFNKGLGELALSFDDWKKISSIFSSTGDKEEYNWLGATPAMTEWKDSRQINGLRPFSYTLTNQDWANGIEVDRNALKDDKLGQIPARVREMVRAYYKLILKSVFSTLDDGASGKCFDSGYFFAASRTIGKSANIANLLSGSYSDSAAEIRAGIAAAATAMMQFQDDFGNPMGLVPDTIVCGPVMITAIKEAIRPDYAGAQRPEVEYVKNLIVSPWIDSDTDDWFTLCTTEEVKPIIFQNREDPNVTSLDQPDSLQNFMRKKLLYGVDARFTTGYGDPRTAIRLHNT